MAEKTQSERQQMSVAELAEYVVRPIGFVTSPYKGLNDVQHKHRGWTDAEATVRLLPQHAGKIRGLEGFSHIILLFWNHLASQWRMPKNHGKPVWVKVFATRMPVRPNPIGMSVVELLACDPQTGILQVKGLDAIEGTPILDIKPYIPHFDSWPDAKIPEWVAKRLNGDHQHAGHHYHAEDSEPNAGQRKGGSK